ncbi:beta-chimaerin isoform X3 [Agrilus planipennis]|uniref:Beta-chimaerin isoform X2 n=1 Tax=Agrilus planipennis TaxID=224129 RepID=A0A1W4W3H2_AGRPL|nr:beta-chimaerin isoform X2 [Agrilus planipennis]XP_025835215.1 beta-chimaerin isoform X3 [Agrilus planipennis]
MGLESEPISLWKNDLYRMQLDAPVPIPIICNEAPPDLPNYFGRDYHGNISHIEANNLLSCRPNGAYLVRKSKSANGEFHTLSLKFNDKIHHYKLFYDKSGIYVREKRYDCVRSLVADGLVTMYLELKAPSFLQKLPSANYHESPYMTLNKKKLQTLTRERSKLIRNNSFLNAISNIENQQLTTNGEKYEKNHVFKITTFKGLNWCEMCGNFLWGFTAQGVKCDDCGIIAHGRCSEKFPNDCIPDIKYLRGVFGIELTTLLTAHNAKLPFVVTKCVSEVEARGLTVEGIYRLSGFAEEIEAIKLGFDTDGEKADLSQDKYPNVNVITGALKLYLRLLPIPLITFLVHPMLIDAMQQKSFEKRLSSVKQALLSLPKPHYCTLHFMMDHLNRVSLHAAINKMNPHNLATVFAPTLIGPPESGSLMLPDMTTDILLIETLILHCEKIFGTISIAAL